MRLTVRDRILLPEILPEAGNMVEMILVRSIREKVELSARDVEEYGIVSTGDGGMRWDGEKDSGVEVEFVRAEVELLKRAYEKLDGEKRVTQRNFDLCLKLRDLE